MKRFYTFVFILSFFSVFNSLLNAQTLYNNNIDSIEREVLPTVDNKVLLSEELAARVPGRAPMFAKSFERLSGPEINGTWTSQENNLKTWQLRVISTGARSLNFGFNKYQLPPSANLYIYSSDNTIVQGPFTLLDNEVHDQLWTPVISSDDVIIELQVDINEVNLVQLELSFINHDFLGFGQSASGSCNLDVICGADDGWEIVDDYRDIIQSVAVIGTNGNRFCTGFLINNVRQDCTPYFITAAHCGINSNNASSMVAYWNFQNSTCRQPNSSASGGSGNGQLNDFNTGAIHRATHTPSDVTLVEFDDPLSASANGYLAGWNATDETGWTAIAIHHPSTDEKRISFENDATYLGNWTQGDAQNPNGDHVIVPDWDIGTTEGGSSGSPLFNQNKHVIGQLHGGGAACGNDLYDSYGWFHTSWTGGGTNSTSLKPWLDPDDTNTLILDGRYNEVCNQSITLDQPIVNLCGSNTSTFTVAIATSQGFDDIVTISLNNVPEGLTYTIADNPISPGISTNIMFNNANLLNSGTYNIEIIGSANDINTTTNLILQVQTFTPSNPTSIAPENNSVGQSTTINLSWSYEDNPFSYDIQIATDVNFNEIVFEMENLQENGISIPNLNIETQYFWRVKAENSCGTGDFSQVFNFLTASCNLISYQGPELDITDQYTTVSSLEVSVTQPIADLNVKNITGSHSYLGDLTFVLTSPEGTSVFLIDSECGSFQDFNVGFDDDATQGIPCPYNDGGTYNPQGNLSDFYGENPSGTWILSIADSAFEDEGALQNWSLEICTQGNVPTLVTSTNQISACANTTPSFIVVAEGTFQGIINLESDTDNENIIIDFESNTTTNGAETEVSITIDPNTPPGSYTITIIASDENTEASTFISLVVLALPGLPTLGTPAHQSSVPPNELTFQWQATVSDGQLYQFEIATDIDFNNIIYSNVIVANTITINNVLQGETQYFWRVTSQNDCGFQPSEVFSFTTEIVDNVQDQLEQSITMMPNPTNDFVSINLGTILQEDIKISVFTLDGRQILEQKIRSGSNQSQIDLANQPAGVYLLMLQGNSLHIHRKLAKLQ